MEFAELRKEIKQTSLDALRMDCDNYLEAVVVKKELEGLRLKLEQFFGEPAWPSKKHLAIRCRDLINGYGGIKPGQTMYFCSQGSEDFCAMLWPWQDGERATLKIIQK